jgi:membrane-bound lytic murein transglycosylase D
MNRRHPVLLTACVLSVFVAGCGDKKQPAAKTIPAPQASAPTLTQSAQTSEMPDAKKSGHQGVPPTATQDAATQLIALVEREYQAGQTNYRAGHLAAAKQSFDSAFNLLLSSPITPKQDPRLKDEFDKVVEQVNQLEMAALKQGDGFTEQNSVPAPIAEINDMTFPVDPNVRAKAQAELATTTSDLPLVMNDYVASFLGFFQTQKGHGVIERALVRAGKYRPMIQRILKEEGVPQDLLYLAQAESGFQPTALNPSGARGMWQLMSSRAGEYGLQHTWWIDERQDPEKATRAAARHLHDLYNQFGDWYLVMAAYNSGPGNVQYAVEKTGYADFWELYKRNVLPKETKNYVPIILAMTIMEKNPQQYGLENVAPELPLEVDTVKVDYPVDLRLVAECADVPVQRLMELNPSLLRLTTPRDSSFDLHLPVGTKERYLAAINLIPEDKRVSWRYHHLVSGDTLGTIARQYHTTPQAIAEANNLESVDAPLRLSKLIIPITAPRVAAAAAAPSFSKTPTRYAVRRGDTVLSVADDFGIPAERIRRWNHLRSNTLQPGSHLILYRPVMSAAETHGATQKSSHPSVSRATTSHHSKSSKRPVRSSAHASGSKKTLSKQTASKKREHG